MPAPDPSPRDPDSLRPRHIGAGIGVVVLMVLCCAGPALIVSGALAGFGAWLGNPWVIATAVLIAAGTAAFVARRRTHHHASCCPPADSADQDGRADEAAKQGPNDRRPHRPV
ncbi:phage holin family protein [Streptomyces sp. CC228A]|uniref:phage holin family protein n=1 Tax=Streptomyces sp. CC228A TaxID=2898186 RepID=UPI001F214B2C|nr:hypothetical protein [Streptomyces sp. CC228A]